MTSNALRELLHSVPFQPFTIRLADGRGVYVPHPDFITVTGGGQTAFVTNPYDENFTIIDLMLAAQLESGDTASAVQAPPNAHQP